MKVFSRVTAAAAVGLILCSMFMLLVTTIFRGPIMERFFNSPALFYPFRWYSLLNPYFLLCLLQIVCIFPMIFLGGRKKCVLWIEIVLILLMVFCIPAVIRLADYLCYNLFYVFRSLDYRVHWGEEAAEYYAELLRERWLEILFKQFQRALTWEWIRSYLIEPIWGSEEYQYIQDVASWAMGAARLGQVLGFVSIGASMAGAVKAKKKN